MAARQARLTLAVLACAGLLLHLQARAGQRSPQGDAKTYSRIVSLVPALTEMLFAIGAGGQVAGVSNFDNFPAEVTTLPRVGALLDPDTERILALRPDMVIVYASQTDAQDRFRRAGIHTFTYRHGGLDAIMASVRELGAVTGHRPAADALARRLTRDLEMLRTRTAGRTRPRTMLVFERQPRTLRNMYVSGGAGFLHEMLDAAGGANVFADVKRESVQPSQETVLARAPEVILEVRATTLTGASNDRALWAPLASVPAVRNGRIHFLVGQHFVVPGPRFVQGIEALARALHPDAFR